MKKEFCTIELAHLVKELQQVVNGRINKVVQYSEKQLAFECFKTGVGRVFLNIMRPGLMWLGISKHVGGDFGFYKNLAKQMTGAKITSISQIGSERLIKIEFKVQEKKRDLYIELFNKGNIILCNEEGKIISLWETQMWKDRELKIGVLYVLPVKLINVFTLSEEEFRDVLTTIDETVSKTLASDLGLGGTYAQELCLISGVNKTKNKLTMEEMRVVQGNLQFLLKRKIDARIVFDNGVVKDIVPFPLKLYESLQQSSFRSYTEALDGILSKSIEQEQAKQVASKSDTKRKKLLNIIEVQKLYLDALQKQIADAQRKGELVYEQYQKLKSILDAVTKQKLSFREIKARAKEFGMKDFDEKSGDIIVEV